jgi:hypothetical protein
MPGGGGACEYDPSASLPPPLPPRSGLRRRQSAAINSVKSWRNTMSSAAAVNNLLQSLDRPRPLHLLHLHHPCPMTHEEAKGLCLHHWHRVEVMRLFSTRLHRHPRRRLHRRRWGACWPERDLHGGLKLEPKRILFQCWDSECGFVFALKTQ